MSKFRVWQSSLALVALSLVMRTPLTSVGALLPEIRDSLHLAAWQVSLIASVPVLLFGFSAFISPFLVRQFGLNRTVFVLALLLLVAIAVRVSADFLTLLIGTIAVGFAIAVGNVLLPGFVRSAFSEKVPVATGAYAAVFGLSASIAASLAVPLSEAFNSWRLSLLVWLPFALLAALVWWPFAKVSHGTHASASKDFSAERKAVLKSGLGWSIILFFAFQSAGFYLVLNWLASLLRDFGFSAVESGNLLALTTFIGVPFSLVASFYFAKMRSLAVFAVLVSLLTASGYVVLLFEPQFAIIGCVLIGLGQATTFPMALSFISTRAANHVQTTQLSTLAQGIGYLVAAACTYALGWMRDSTGSWNSGLLLILVVTIAQTAAGFIAGRPGKISAA